MSTADAAVKCGYCGSLPHQGVCPTVKAIEYHENGTVKRVEFKTANDYPALPQIDWTNPRNTGAAVVDLAGMQTYTIPPR